MNKTETLSGFQHCWEHLDNLRAQMKWKHNKGLVILDIFMWKCYIYPEKAAMSHSPNPPDSIYRNSHFMVIKQTRVGDCWNSGKANRDFFWLGIIFFLCRVWLKFGRISWLTTNTHMAYFCKLANKKRSHLNFSWPIVSIVNGQVPRCCNISVILPE